MVLGITGVTRERQRGGLWAVADSAGMADFSGPSSGARSWATERGQPLWEGAADLSGGFPGYAERGGRLVGASVRVTDRYLLVEEGRPHGFGLPLGWLCGAHPVGPDFGDAALRVRYVAGSQVRSFAVRFRGQWLGPRARSRAEGALAALFHAGLPEADERAAGEPSLAVGWDEAAHYEGENVIWTGRAVAPLDGPDRGPCDVWLTTRSVIWGSGTGEGIYRLALDRVLDVTAAHLADRGRTPAAYLGLAAAGCRHELAFLFDRHSPPDRNLRERGAFVVGLRSRAVPLGGIPAAPQPWRVPDGPDGALDDDPDAPPPPTTRARRLAGALRDRWPIPAPPAAPRPDAPPAATTPDDAPAQPATPADDRPTALATEAAAVAAWPAAPASAASPSRVSSPALAVDPTEPVAEPWAEPEPMAVADPPVEATPIAADAAGSPPGTPGAAGDPAATTPADVSPGATASVPAAAPSSDGLARVRAYEASALVLLAGALRQVDDRADGRPPAAETAVPAPPAGERAAAYAALAALAADGLGADAVAARRARLDAIDEAVSRLRALVELRDAGYLSDDALTAKRAAIAGGLSTLLTT